MYEYKARVDRVVDGDTVDFIVDLGFSIQSLAFLRLVGVDTPERGHPDWDRATFACASLLKEQTSEDGYVVIRTNKTGKYGRWLVEIKGVTDELAKEWPY